MWNALFAAWPLWLLVAALGLIYLIVRQLRGGR